MSKADYDTLGLSPQCSNEELKRVYVELMKKWHPDTNKLHSAPRQFQRIKAAYDNIKEWRKNPSAASQHTSDYRHSYTYQNASDPIFSRANRAHQHHYTRPGRGPEWTGGHAAGEDRNFARYAQQWQNNASFNEAFWSESVRQEAKARATATPSVRSLRTTYTLLCFSISAYLFLRHVGRRRRDALVQSFVEMDQGTNTRVPVQGRGASPSLSSLPFRGRTTPNGDRPGEPCAPYSHANMACLLKNNYLAHHCVAELRELQSCKSHPPSGV
eukprot:gnl/Spiro4/3324_TR1619_c0_g1_i1.p1 gnl/Spiro4/3324_TR1619_c0_g1~~gnl/Spiro4/3324_TR1619_c0_g1_i1.p1  ORF type:complete len:271 (-),score=35.29 gnl/Spiro4/3324_TR1619_c0_g1_i1:68-880(-)